MKTFCSVDYSKLVSFPIDSTPFLFSSPLPPFLLHFLFPSLSLKHPILQNECPPLTDPISVWTLIFLRTEWFYCSETNQTAQLCIQIIKKERESERERKRDKERERAKESERERVCVCTVPDKFVYL